MTSNTELLAVAFANTLSSAQHDRIATVEELQGWATPWPHLAKLLTHLPAEELSEIHALRDATQLVLHHLTDHGAVPRELMARVTRCGLMAAPFRLLPGPAGEVTIRSAGQEAATHLLGRTIVDLLLSANLKKLRRCDGAECRKVFLTHRSNRRWCDGRICGNRARVAAHMRRSRVPNAHGT